MIESIEFHNGFVAFMKRKRIEGRKLFLKIKANNEILVQENINLMGELRINQNKIAQLNNELLFKQIRIKNEFLKNIKSEIENMSRKHRMEMERLVKRQEVESLKLFNVPNLDQCLDFCEPDTNLFATRTSSDRSLMDAASENPNQPSHGNHSSTGKSSPIPESCSEVQSSQPKYYLSADEKLNHRRNSLHVHIDNYAKNLGRPPLTPLLEISSSQVSSQASSQRSENTHVRSDHDNIVDSTIGEISLTMKSPSNPSSQEERMPRDLNLSTPSILKFDPHNSTDDQLNSTGDEQLSRPSFLDEDSPHFSPSSERNYALPRSSYFFRPSFLQSIEFNHQATDNLCHLDPRLPSEIPTLTSSAYALSPASSQEETVVPKAPSPKPKRNTGGRKRGGKKQAKSTSIEAKASSGSESALRSLENTVATVDDSVRNSNDCDLSINASLRSTRHKKPVSYQEPKCNRKIRKGDEVWCKT